MKPTQQLHDLGQSIWLDNITRDLLDSGTLERYIRELSVTGLTSNPTIFDHAIKNSASYDAELRARIAKGASAETLFFELALEDLKRAAALFRHLHDQTNGVDGWVSLEVSPLLAEDSVNTLRAAEELFLRAGLRNPFIKIPGTKESLHAIGSWRGRPESARVADNRAPGSRVHRLRRGPYQFLGASRPVAREKNNTTTSGNRNCSALLRIRRNLRGESVCGLRESFAAAQA